MAALHSTPVTPLRGNRAGPALGPRLASSAPTVIALMLFGLPQAVFGQVQQAHTPLFAETTPLALTIEHVQGDPFAAGCRPVHGTVGSASPFIARPSEKFSLHR